MSLTRAIAIAGLCCILMNGGCASGTTYEPETYVVRPQDTLYSIAWRHNLDYRELARWNNIGTDYRVSVGQLLVLQPHGEAPIPVAPQPAAALGNREPRSADAPGVVNHAPGRPNASSTIPGIVPRSPERAGPPQPSNGGTSKWVWPTNRLSAPRPVPGGGILLLGRLGQDVRAAGAGRVVYTGDGLRGYGNLIIIKHGDGLLSSYAHNRELLVHEGQDVGAGQVIAHMGMGPHQVSALYFEIRVNGKPTDPLRYLRTAPGVAR